MRVCRALGYLVGKEGASSCNVRYTRRRILNVIRLWTGSQLRECRTGVICITRSNNHAFLMTLHAPYLVIIIWEIRRRLDISRTKIRSGHEF